MACDIAIGLSILKSCDNSQGGMAEFYPFNEIADAFTIVDGVVTSMNVGLTAAYKYEIKGDNNTFTDVQVADKKTGNSVTTQTVAFEVKQIDAVKGEELGRLVQGNNSGIYKSKAGKYLWVGHETGFNVTATVTSLSGGAVNDFNGYQVELVSENRTKAPILDDATVTAFLAIVV